MSTVFVYRVERIQDGYGPYQTYPNASQDEWEVSSLARQLNVEESIDIIDFENRHPSPYQDFPDSKYDQLMDGNDQTLFGFGSRSQYREWFYNETIRNFLAHKQYGLSVYTVDDEWVSKLKSQLVFVRKKATLHVILHPETMEPIYHGERPLIPSELIQLPSFIMTS